MNMKKYLYTLLFISLAFVSCVNTHKSEFENQAIETFKTSFINLADDSKDAQFDNIKTVFTSKNLCILHAEISGIKDLNKVEYLFLTLDGKNYEAFSNLDDDSVFVSEPTLIKVRKGTIYENLDFEDAILFRASVYMNYFGKEVGTNNTDFFIKSPINTGLWELRDYQDEFGDKTSGKFLSLYGKGTWSNSIETDQKLIALLFVNEEIAVFRLVRNGRLVDEFSGRIKLKDGEGGIHELYFSERDRDIAPVWKNEIKEFREIIEKQGILSVIAEVGGGLFSQKYIYKFKFNLEGFKKAMYFLNPRGFGADDSDEVTDEEIEAVKDKIVFNVETEFVKEEVDTTNSDD